MLDIIIELKNGIILANLFNDLTSSEAHSEYAFYLYKDNVRVDTQWYSTSSSVSFKINNEGIYYVRGFVRMKGSSESEIISSKKIHYNTVPYNLTGWNRSLSLVSFESFEDSFNFQDGIFQINYNNQNIDILIDGVGSFKKERGILVCLTGAVPGRKDKYAPFFSGINVAEKLNMPLVSISDPSLAINFHSNLAWYAGNEKLNNLAEVLAKILDGISRITNSKLILFGGSGGGFAALSIINHMQTKAFGVVWNPQTSISKYESKAVANYLAISFQQQSEPSSFYQLLENTGVVHDLVKLYEDEFLNGSEILYLQNIGDKFHLEHHAKPLMNALSAKQKSEKVYHTSNGITFWLNNWGDGHIAPSPDLILLTLRKLIENNNTLEIALIL